MAVLKGAIIRKAIPVVVGPSNDDERAADVLPLVSCLIVEFGLESGLPIQ
jgi:hypothetical protein